MMPPPRPEDFVHYDGTYKTIEWYFQEDAVMPGYDYYLSIGKADQEKFDYLAKHLGDRPHGDVLPKKMLNIEDKKHGIYALKPNDERLFNFMTKGAKVIVTNGYQKQSQKLSKQGKRALKTAIEMKADYEKRARTGKYYPEGYG